MEDIYNSWVKPNHLISRIILSIFFVGILVSPFNLIRIIFSYVPEGVYTISVEFQIEGDYNRYLIPLTVNRIRNEYYDREGNVEDVEIDYLLLDYELPHINLPNFVLEYANMPERVESGNSYDVVLEGEHIIKYDKYGDPLEFEHKNIDCLLIIPELSRERLGISIEDNLNSIGIFTYIEHISLLTMSILCIILYYKAWKRYAN